MNSQNSWYHCEKLPRIVEESLEVALVVCNAELNQFTVAKIFDIFNQIIPTAFILNTGYWPFFNSLQKQCLCICGRYALVCRHTIHNYHWLDLDPIPNDNTSMFNTKLGQLTVKNSNIDLIPIIFGVTGYSLNIKLTFEYKKIDRGRPKRKKDKTLTNPDQIIHAVICGRYTLPREYYPALHSVIFKPNPFYYATYGTYFPKLLQVREMFTSLSSGISREFYKVPIETMPHYTISLHYTNLPVYQYNKMLNVELTRLDSNTFQKTCSNKKTQTEITNATKVWKYKEIIENLKPLWNVNTASTSNSLFYPNPFSSYGPLDTPTLENSTATEMNINTASVNTNVLDGQMMKTNEEIQDDKIYQTIQLPYDSQPTTIDEVTRKNSSATFLPNQSFHPNSSMLTIPSVQVEKNYSNSENDHACYSDLCQERAIKQENYDKMFEIEKQEKNKKDFIHYKVPIKKKFYEP